MLKCSSALSAAVPKFSLSVRVPEVLMCPSALRVLFECLRVLSDPDCPLSFQMPYEGSSSKKALQHTGNELLNSFIEFLKKFSEYMLYITAIVFYLLENNICNFYHVLLARYKSFIEVSKTFLKYFVKFQKTKYDGLQSTLLSNIVVLQLQGAVLLLQL